METKIRPTLLEEEPVKIETTREILSDSLGIAPLPADSLRRDSIQNKYLNLPVYDSFDTTRIINYWRITELTGERIEGNPDTLLTDYFNRTTVEGQGISVAYLGNLGQAAESRIFFERAPRSNFMFMDAFWPYEKSPGKFNFINTKIPHTNISYSRAGSRTVREERLQAIMALNIGKKLNLGFDVDYLYARGFYKSQQAKRLDWTFFSNYISDRHKVHLFVSPTNYTNAENGGVADDIYITHPELAGNRITSQTTPTQLENVWNHIKGNRIYLNYHYNLGFERKIDYIDEEGNQMKQFVPVSSIIYTFDYTDRQRTFYTTNTAALDTYYDNRDFMGLSSYPGDSTAYRSIKNTLALSLREGFSKWAKFDLTAYINQNNFHYALQDVQNSPYNPESGNISFGKELTTRHIYDYSTYVGGELAKRQGKILRYDAQARFGILGANLGDIDLTGHIETRIPIFRDTTSINLNARLKTRTPSVYETDFKSKYFFWHNLDFDKEQRVYFGADLIIPQTKTKIEAGVENVTNYIYFDGSEKPKQHKDNLQVIAIKLEQNFKYRALNWDNRLVYQISSDQDIIPLPDLALYSSAYLDFKIAKVLTIQMGVHAHYWTKYYSPTWEPALQQFRLQKETKVGNYPIVGAFVNAHLKQARFFIEYYNAGSSVLSPSEYFSMPHYPVNPTVLRMGVSVDFIN
ncbi:putative porin [Bacteroidales bacterium OttesenSCG-928-J19]|nr:putative porin [Bacteroidales bacterium OttesenSCG-928-J19]